MTKSNAYVNFCVRSLKITFGRYVGETLHERDKAESDFRKRWPLEPRLPNELIARDQMQIAPPHLLLTNYAMLEYLLLRPQDSAFFDGPTAKHWRAIVLDEVHVYNGARGTEIGMLLRRVRDRVLGERAWQAPVLRDKRYARRRREGLPRPRPVRLGSIR